MAVKSIKPYPAIHTDRQEGYAPVQMLYVCWEGHLLFAAPAIVVGPPEATVRSLLETQFAAIIKPDPDAEKINWDEVEWVRKGEPATVDLDKSLAENGLRHKDQILFRTPGLNTVCAA